MILERESEIYFPFFLFRDLIIVGDNDSLPNKIIVSFA